MPTTAENSSVVYRAHSGRVYGRAATSGPVPSILTYPVRDYAGDEVKPGGGKWPAEVFPNWTHDIPVGRGSVSLKALTLNGETHPVDYGETRFFQSASDIKGLQFIKREVGTYKPIGTYTHKAILQAASQVERLVRDDVATGVSVEFKAAGPKGQAFWDLDEWSELEGRSCRHYENWIGLTYAHALQPVNPGARTVLTADDAHIEKAVRIAQTKRIGSEQLCDIVYKAFLPFKAIPSNRVTVRVESKAMDDELSDIPPVGGTVAMDEEQTSDMSEGPTPAVRTCIEGAQMLLDLCDQLEASIGQSEHKKARKYVTKIIAELQATADEMNAMGEKVRADLEDLDEGPKDEAAETSGDTEEDAGEDIEEKALPDLDVPEEIAPIERDDDGYIVCKSFPNWKPRRFHISELKPAAVLSEEASLEAEFKAAQAELNREYRKARPILRAARANRRI